MTPGLVKRGVKKRKEKENSVRVVPDQHTARRTDHIITLYPDKFCTVPEQFYVQYVYVILMFSLCDASQFLCSVCWSGISFLTKGWVRGTYATWQRGKEEGGERGTRHKVLSPSLPLLIGERKEKESRVPSPPSPPLFFRRPSEIFARVMRGSSPCSRDNCEEGKRERERKVGKIWEGLAKKNQVKK